MCPFCIYSTNRPAAMECHLKTHLKMEHRCRICQGLWPNRPSLEAHMRAHRLGNHYKCEQCGYLSKTANKLIEHVRVHTGERPFHCDLCSYSCKRKDNLNLHKRLKHAPRQTFTCRECAFTTTHPFVFSRHLKKHQGGGPKQGEGDDGTGEEGRSPGGLPTRRSLLGSAGLTASQALRSAALSRSLGGGPHSSNGCPRDSSPSGTLVDQYRNCERAHLIPLTTLFTHSNRRTFHSSRRLSLSASPSHKHSFLAYLGLTERAKTD